MQETDWKTKACTYKALLADTAEVIEQVTRSTPLTLTSKNALDAQSEAIRQIIAD